MKSLVPFIWILCDVFTAAVKEIHSIDQITYENVEELYDTFLERNEFFFTGNSKHIIEITNQSETSSRKENKGNGLMFKREETIKSILNRSSAQPSDSSSLQNVVYNCHQHNTRQSSSTITLNSFFYVFFSFVEIRKIDNLGILSDENFTRQFESANSDPVEYNELSGLERQFEKSEFVKIIIDAMRTMMLHIRSLEILIFKIKAKVVGNNSESNQMTISHHLKPFFIFNLVNTSFFLDNYFEQLIETANEIERSFSFKIYQMLKQPLTDELNDRIKIVKNKKHAIQRFRDFLHTPFKTYELKKQTLSSALLQKTILMYKMIYKDAGAKMRMLFYGTDLWQYLLKFTNYVDHNLQIKIYNSCAPEDTDKMHLSFNYSAPIGPNNSLVFLCLDHMMFGRFLEYFNILVDSRTSEKLSKMLSSGSMAYALILGFSLIVKNNYINHLLTDKVFLNLWIKNLNSDISIIDELFLNFLKRHKFLIKNAISAVGYVNEINQRHDENDIKLFNIEARRLLKEICLHIHKCFEYTRLEVAIRK